MHLAGIKSFNLENPQDEGETHLKGSALSLAKLVNRTAWTRVYGCSTVSIVKGEYEPTNITWGAPPGRSILVSNNLNQFDIVRLDYWKAKTRTVQFVDAKYVFA